MSSNLDADLALSSYFISSSRLWRCFNLYLIHFLCLARLTSAEKKRSVLPYVYFSHTMCECLTSKSDLFDKCVSSFSDTANGFIYHKQCIYKSSLRIRWFKQMSCLRMLLKALFFVRLTVEFVVHSHNWSPEYPMNKLPCFIIDWEKRCRCDNRWQNGPAANWKHSWRGSRCSCRFLYPAVKCRIKDSSSSVSSVSPRPCQRTRLIRRRQF